MADRSTPRSGDVLKFLDTHRLDHNPDHYAFAWRYLAKRDPSFSSAVAELIDGGVRLSERDVARLSASAPAPLRGTDTVAPELERISLDILAIITAASGETTTFGRELTLAATDLIQGKPEDLRAIVGRMIAYSSQAEQSLTAMSRRTQQLYGELRALVHIAQRDPARGVLPREAVEQHLRDVLAMQPGGIVIAVVTLDDARRLRVSYGEAVTARVVRALAETLGKHLGTTAIGDIGGDRLLVVVEATDPDGVAARLNDARMAFSGRTMRVREDDREIGTVSFSGGLAPARSRSFEVVLQAVVALAGQATAGGGDMIVVEGAVTGV